MKRTCSWCMAAAVTIGAVVALAGCKPSEAVRQAQVVGNATKTEGSAAALSGTPLDQATLGMVSGTVRFSGQAPAKVKIDMSMDPVCSITGGENLAEQYVVKDGNLANVYVYVKSGPPASMLARAPISPPIVLDQVGCKYVPHVIAVMRGGSVEFRNSDGTMHNIHMMPTADNLQIDISQGAKGTPQVRQFNHAEEMVPVRCNNHPWMNAFVNVSATPFFAVTDMDGHFGISGLPAGTYILAAVHEKMGEQTMTVMVEPKGNTKADFSFSIK